jgi:four helix bundle protein
MAEYKEYSFEKLEAWKESRILVMKIYTNTKSFPADEKYGLTIQIRRAAISISSNIAEGSGRLTGPDQKNFYKNAFGSLMEVLNQDILANDLGYMEDQQLDEVRAQVDRVAVRLSGLSNSR